MSNLVRAPELTNALRTLLGYLGDLQRASFDDSSLKLRLVVNYAQKDPVVRYLAELLRHRISTEALVERTREQSFLPPPEGTVDRMAFAFTLLVHLNKGWKFDLRALLTRDAFQGAGIEARLKDFNQKVTLDLIRTLEKVLAALEAAHPPDSSVDPDPALRAALAVADGGAPAAASEPAVSEPAASEPAVSEPATSATVRPVAPARTSPTASDEDPDVSLDVELLALELGKDRPDPTRLAELEAALSAASPALGKLARTTVALGTALAGLHGREPARA